MQLQFAMFRRDVAEAEQPTLDERKSRASTRRWEDTDVLSKGQLIEQILLLNPGATSEFLADFSVSELSQYLNHLLWLQQPRSGQARWTRPGETPAVVARSRVF
ncbi:MAG: hypothetical protein Kow0022_01020 [Phycisphaerales bacterium]